MTEKNEHDDDRLGRSIDLEQWEASEPPPDFASKVLARIQQEDGARAAPTSAPSRRRRPMSWRWGVAGGAAASLAAAAAIAMRISGPPSHGEAIAAERSEVAIGSRARAVLEPGAQVAWSGDDVEQRKGDVFYRVEPGARFRVHTPAGDVEVKGTCFTVKVRVPSDATSSESTALAFVAVHEGKVAVSRGAEHVDLGAGEGARTGEGGVLKSTDLGEAQRAFETTVASARADKPFASANENLVAQVSDYRQRLEAIVTQKSALETQLKDSEARLAAARADGAAPLAKGEFDLTQADWADLAKQGRLVYRVPCDGREGWAPSAEKLQSLGLTPQDGATIKEAYARSAKRVWSQVGPICTAALGGNAELAEKLGAATCQHLVYDIEASRDKEGTAEAMTQVAEIRAGLRPEPGPGEKVSPVLRMFLVLTGANGAFENDLAQSFGPDEAHRLAHASDMCNSDNRWGGGKKR